MRFILKVLSIIFISLVLFVSVAIILEVLIFGERPFDKEDNK